MASLAMKRITICGLKSNRKDILETLQRQGTIEVQDFVSEDEVFKKVPMPVSGVEFEKSIHEAEQALEILTQYDGEKPAGLLSSFKGREVLGKQQVADFKDKCQAAQSAVTNILKLNKDIAEKKAEIVKCNQQMEMLEPWKALDIPLGFAGTEKTAVFIGAFSKEWSLEEIYTGVAERTQANIDVQIINASKEQTCVMIVCMTEDKDQVGTALRGLGFAYPSINCDNIPSEERTRLSEKVLRFQQEIQDDINGILSYEELKVPIKFFRDLSVMREEKYAVTSSLPQSAHTFLLTGYAPAKYISQIEEVCEQYGAVIETEDPDPDEEVPVLLSNNAFSESVQGVVEGYALPLKGEVDPTFIISLFYFIFFGFMLADAAIGILMVIATAVLLLVNKNMESGLRKNVKLFLFGGIMTTFWGVMFGSYFGDMIPVVSESFFGHQVTVKPLWLDMTANPMAVLALSLGFGVLHIFVALGIAGYQMLRNKDIVGFIFDVLAWYVILGGLLVECFSMPMIMGILFGGRDPFLSAQVGQIGLIAAGVGALAVVIMGGRESKNPVKRLLKGAYAVYGITSYLSDILSYSRLLALGLATGVISSVANMMGTMFGSGVVKVIVYIFIFVVINAINIGINALGAYVHTNRLQYVEFFGKFYTGGARAFNPFSIKTKYYKFKEN